MRPPESIDPRIAAVTIAVLRGARTVREVAKAAGIRSSHSSLRWLRAARLAGLVEWEDYRAGTLRATVEARKLLP